jgi:hypothetical protein
MRVAIEEFDDGGREERGIGFGSRARCGIGDFRDILQSPRGNFLERNAAYSDNTTHEKV